MAIVISFILGAIAGVVSLALISGNAYDNGFRDGYEKAVEDK